MKESERKEMVLYCNAMWQKGKGWIVWCGLAWLRRRSKVGCSPMGWVHRSQLTTPWLKRRAGHTLPYDVRCVVILQQKERDRQKKESERIKKQSKGTWSKASHLPFFTFTDSTTIVMVGWHTTANSRVFNDKSIFIFTSAFCAHLN